MTISSPQQPSPLTTNPDLLPTTRAQRTSTAWEIASLWIGLVVGLPSYYIAGTLIEKGMTWWQGLAIVVGAKAILLLPSSSTATPAPATASPSPSSPAPPSASTGPTSPPSSAPSSPAAGTTSSKFGIETWLGGQALFILLPSSITNSRFANQISWLATSPLELLCFAAFWLAQLAALWKGMRGIRQLEKYSAPILVALASLLLSWACVKAGGFGPMLYQPSRLSPAQFWSLFFPSLTANIGSWAAMALSIPDFTRYARSQRDQVLGQLGLPLFMGSFAFVGLAVTSSTEIIFGRIISNPVKLLAEIGGTFTMLLAIPGISLAILTTNIPANIVAPANALVSLSPSVFTFKRGALLTAVIGAVVFQPWRIVNSPEHFVYTWLVGYSAVMGPLAGVLLTDYYIIRRTVLDVDQLYSSSPAGIYYYHKGYNLLAMVSLVVSFAPIVPGFLHKLGLVENLPHVLIFVYDVGWFFGFFGSALVYSVLVQCVGGLAGHKIKAKVGGVRSPSLMDSLLHNVVE